MFNKIWEKILIKAIISEINSLKRCDVLPIFVKVKKNWRQNRNLIFFIFRLHFASDLWDKRRGRRAFNAWRRPSTTTWVSQLEGSIRTSKSLGSVYPNILVSLNCISKSLSKDLSIDFPNVFPKVFRSVFSNTFRNIFQLTSVRLSSQINRYVYSFKILK
jgi:hypothetical protein